MTKFNDVLFDKVAPVFFIAVAVHAIAIFVGLDLMLIFLLLKWLST